MSNERRNRKSNGAGRAPAPGGAIARLVELTAPGTGKLSVEVDRVRRAVGPAPASVLAQKWADWVCRRYAFSVALASLPAARKPPAAVGRLLANAGAVAADLYLALRAMVRIVLGAGLIHARDSDDLLRDELLKIAAAFCGVATVSKHPLIAGLERAAVSSAAGLPPRTYARLSDLVLPALIARVTHDRLGARTGLAVSMIAGAGLRGAAAYGTMRAFSILALSHIEEIDRLHPWRRHEERARLSKIDVEDLARVVHAVAWADRSFGARERAMIGEILNPLRITGEMKLRVRDWQKSPARLGAVHADRAPLRTRELIYRAAFLVAASDGPVNARETRVLRDAAKKLDLAPPVVEEIHAETVTWFEF